MSDGGEKTVTKKTNKSSFHFIAGLASGTLSAVLLQPADLLKTRIQETSKTKVPNPLLTTLRSIAASPSPLTQLWRGTIPSALRTGLGSALYFGSLNTLRTHMGAAGWGTVGGGGERNPGGRLSNTANLLTGAAARVSAGFVIMPITVIKVRFESSLYSYKGLHGAVADTVKHEGLRGLFTGFGATAVRDAPYAGLYVLFYEESKRRLAAMNTPAPSTRVNFPSQSTLYINFVSGLFAAGLATALTNPFDAIKTRLQLMPAKYGNMLKAGSMMIQQEGVRSLFDGLALRMGRKAMSSALAWTAYEELIRRAEIRWEGEKYGD